MSSNEASLSHLNFPGGVPKSVDFAPSILYIIAFAVTAPLLVWRVIKQDSRCMDLLRPGLFWCARMTAYGLRAYMAKNSFNSSELIAELVMLSVGTLMLIEPLVGIWKRHSQSVMMLEDQNPLMLQAATFLRLGVMIAVILSIVAAVDIKPAETDPSKVSTITGLKEGSVILQLILIVAIMVLTGFTHMQFQLDTRRTAYIFLPAVCTFIVCVYRLVQTFTPDPTASVHDPAIFYIFSSLFEYIAYVSLIAIKIPVWYPGDASPEFNKDLANGDVPMGMTGPSYSASRMENGQSAYAAPRPHSQRTQAQTNYAPPQQPYSATPTHHHANNNY